MTRNVLAVIGIALLSLGGTGIIVGLAWLTVSRVHGNLPYILDLRDETILYLLPALLLMIAIVGACFVAGALAVPTKEERSTRTLRPHTRFHA